jgi:pSer/pThr/pTyr-binding forkhead associated (FHA) protein
MNVGTVGVAPAQLIGLSGNIAGRTIPLRGTLTIGRGSRSGLHLAESAVSRNHAIIRYAQGRWFIQDQSSDIGTYVNSQQVTATALSNGDRIRIGGTEFEFRIG